MKRYEFIRDRQVKKKEKKKKNNSFLNSRNLKTWLCLRKQLLKKPSAKNEGKIKNKFFFTFTQALYNLLRN